jgi:hypothetical protein
VTEGENAAALDQMAKILKADTRPSAELDLARRGQRARPIAEYPSRLHGSRISRALNFVLTAKC